MTLRHRRLLAISVAALPIALVTARQLAFGQSPPAAIPPQPVHSLPPSTTRPAQPPNEPSKVHHDVAPSPTACPLPTTTAGCTIDQLTTPCGERADYKAACQTIFKNDPTVKARYAAPGATKQFYKASAVNFDIGTSDWVTGKYSPYVPSAQASQSGAGTSKEATSERLRLSLVRAHAAGSSVLNAISLPNYESDGAQISSCDEYAYKYYYDWRRFTDAADACGTDYGCVADAALGPTAPPSIASRVLQAKVPAGQHRPLPPASSEYNPSYYQPVPQGAFIVPPTPQGPQLQLLGGDLAKNPWCNAPAGAWANPTWMASVLGQQYVADFSALQAAIGDCSAYYNLSGQHDSGINEVYADEWAWHKSMRSKTASVPDEQFKAIAHRTALLRSLLDEATVPTYVPYYAAASTTPEAILKQYWGVDILGGLPSYGNTTTYVTDSLRVHRERADVAPSAGDTAEAADLVRQASSPGVAAGVNWKADPSARGYPQFLCTPQTTGIPVLGFTHATPAQIAEAGMARCQLLNMEIAEWWRKKRNQALPGGCQNDANCGCLEIDGANTSAACDWSPKAFHDRWVAPRYYWKAHERAAAFCTEYTGAVGQPTAADTHDIDAFEKYLGRCVQAVQDVKEIPHRPGSSTSSGATLAKADWGQLEQADDTLGDKSYFAGYYDAEAGWELRPVALVPSGPSAGDVCQMTGELYSVFQADAWVFGAQINAVDGDAWVVLNDDRGEAANSVTPPLPAHPHMGNGKARYEAHLFVLGYQVFATPKHGTGNTFDAYEKNPAGTAGQYMAAGANDPMTLGSDVESWNIPDPEPEIPFTIGPIPCYISGYAELFLGVNGTATVQLPTTCDAQIGSANHKFGPVLKVTPSASLAGVAEAGVGISGILSVGVRGELTLVDLHIPVITGLSVDLPHGQATPQIDFTVGVDGSLATLGGDVSVYFEILFIDESFQLFSWPGKGPYPFQLVPPFKVSVPIPAVGTYVRTAGLR